MVKLNSCMEGETSIFTRLHGLDKREKATPTSSSSIAMKVNNFINSQKADGGAASDYRTRPSCKELLSASQQLNKTSGFLAVPSQAKTRMFTPSLNDSQTGTAPLTSAANSTTSILKPKSAYDPTVNRTTHNYMSSYDASQLNYMNSTTAFNT